MPANSNLKPLVLASTSPYRQELLNRLRIPYQVEAPRFDEDKARDLWLQGGRPAGDPADLALELAEGKVRSVAAASDQVVIGSDQLVFFEGRILGKPGTDEKAVEQLSGMCGKTHELITAVCLLRREEKKTIVDRTRITLRDLSRQEIEQYVKVDAPKDCAGAYKFEKHGIWLVEKLECADPTAIQGLPLIQLLSALRLWGIHPGVLS